MESTGISSVRHNIAFQWNLKKKEISRHSFQDHRIEPERLVRSNTYRLKDIKDMFFFLELDDHSWLYIKGHSRWSFQLTYAFAVVKDRAFSVKRFKKLEFLKRLDLSYLGGEEEIAYHCMILAQPAVVSKGAEPDLQDIDDEKLKQRYVEFEGTVDSDHRFDGEIPDFTVDMAKQMMPKYKNTNRVLKILALEYLMKNLTAQNLSGVLEIAVDEGITVLQKQCVDFLTSKCTVSLA
ncbi:hypothetical protein AVEN_183167-1 [Araneus ventricosus]|uniref:BTB domain-containing protein n=1 Tax=Araneus ventricosus TaxID=182803 RepID=A0A4Y2IY34_ARAVE|nr:hypothetical protein AVEN_183167-1 [Araneus ventricosus]